MMIIRDDLYTITKQCHKKRMSTQTLIIRSTTGSVSYVVDRYKTPICE